MRGRSSGTARVAIISLLLLALVLPACGGAGGAVGSDERDSSPDGDAGQGDGDARPTMPEMEEYVMGGDLAQSAGDEGGDMPTSGGGDLSASSGVPDGQALPEDFDRRIVKTAELGIEVEDVRDGAAEAQQIAARFDGSVSSSRIEGDDDSVTADMVLTVPSPEFEGALNELRDLGKKVTTDTVRGEDVTEEFVDLESRERNLLAAEQSLLVLYERADSVVMRSQ